MGCGASTEKNVSEKGNCPRQVTAGNITAQNCDKNININIKKANNPVLESNEGNIISISPQESLELLIPKPNASKPKNSIVKKPSTNSKELNQVQAWGKKSSSTETHFLADFRTRHGKEDNYFYEKEYEIGEVDESSRFIGADSGMILEDDSSSEISSSDSSNQLSKINREGDQEESFDVSKIIDVEKFRAANVHGEKKDDENSNEMGLTLKRKLSEELQRLNRSKEDVKEETFNDDLYNEDDKHLIESIEKEFLITQDNFLPGQIVN